MLYYPDVGIAFVHIPKNGGESVRRVIDGVLELDLSASAQDLAVSAEQLQDTLFSRAATDHPHLGKIKFEHLPLSLWKEYFPASWQCFLDLESFAILREPRDRFLSALLQRLGEFKGAKGLRADDPLVTQEALYMCDWLDGRGVFCEYDYVHFIRQIDYVELEGERLVDYLFPIERADLAIKWVTQKSGADLHLVHDHVRREPKVWAKGFQPAARFIGRNLLPTRIKKAIYPLWMNSGVFDNAAARYKEVKLDPQVEAFVADYYRRDAELYREAQVQNPTVESKA